MSDTTELVRIPVSVESYDQVPHERIAEFAQRHLRGPVELHETLVEGWAWSGMLPIDHPAVIKHEIRLYHLVYRRKVTKPVVITEVRMVPLDKLPIYIGRCCREWPLAAGFRGRCGLCGTVPSFERMDGDPPTRPMERERIVVQAAT